MSVGNEIPFRRGRQDHDTGSLVFDQHRRMAVEGAMQSLKNKRPVERSDRRS